MCSTCDINQTMALHVTFGPDDTLELSSLKHISVWQLIVGGNYSFEMFVANQVICIKQDNLWASSLLGNALGFRTPFELTQCWSTPKVLMSHENCRMIFRRDCSR